MIVTNAQFVMSNTDFARCPKPDRPEYAFIGRSNVGKSSLINMLCNHKGLAKTSGKPGKTQLINHFAINDQAWYLVDLPGYGYARVSKKDRNKFQFIITSYLRNRQNLMNTFVLIDSRLEPQQIDLEFMQWMGKSMLPFSIVFTKTDKLTEKVLEKNLEAYQTKLLETWVELPPLFITSAEKKTGSEKLLNYIEELNAVYATH